jgi:hypothetical protein
VHPTIWLNDKGHIAGSVPGAAVRTQSMSVFSIAGSVKVDAFRIVAREATRACEAALQDADATKRRIFVNLVFYVPATLPAGRNERAHARCHQNWVHKKRRGIAPRLLRI